MSRLSFALPVFTTVSFAMTIIATGAGQNNQGFLYEIDPISGAVTLVGSYPSSSWIATSASGTPGAYFATTRINPYLASYPSSSAVLHCTSCPYGYAQWLTADTAYDFSTGRLYAIAIRLGPNPVVQLASMSIGSQQSYGGGVFYPLSLSEFSDIPAGSTATIEAVPGVGIILASQNWLWVVDPVTRQILRIEPFLLAGDPSWWPPAPTSLAYDPDTRRLVAATGVYGNYERGIIYSIDLVTLRATILNPSAPAIYGMAAINNYPEPGTMFLVGGTLVALSWIRRRKCGRLPSHTSQESTAKRAERVLYVIGIPVPNPH